MGTLLTQYTREELKDLIKEAIREVGAESSEKSVSASDERFTAKEAAKFLKLELSTLYEKTSLKLIPHSKKGNKLYFNRTELIEWIENGRVKTKKELETEAATLLYTIKGHKGRNTNYKEAA